MRADLFLVRGGYAVSRGQAQRLIEAGQVFLDGEPVSKCAVAVDEGCEHIVEVRQTEKYVSRGGWKLAKALQVFAVNPTGQTVLDIGASTGGFTDCLLQSGAARVYAVEGGRGQLHPRLAADERVVSLERCNARYLTSEMLGEAFSSVGLAVMDVSFISQTCILPAVFPLLAENGKLISLIKPQFEAGRAAVGKGGLVRRAADREAAITRVFGCALSLGLVPTGLCVSPIAGGDGNIEYLACFCKEAGRVAVSSRDIHAVAAGLADTVRSEKGE